MAKLYKTDGTIISVEPKNGKDFKLEELKEFVGGYIEIVGLVDSMFMVVNEEGKLNGLDFNMNATTVLENYAQCPTNDYIVGDALVCGRNQIL